MRCAAAFSLQHAGRRRGGHRRRRAVPLLQYAGDLRETPPPDFLALEKAECELPPGKAKMILYGRIPALLLRPADGDGAIKVFVATCTHLNCTVAYQADKNRIYCACHDGSLRHRRPRPFRSAAPSLGQFYTKVAGRKLIIALEKANLDKAT